MQTKPAVFQRSEHLSRAAVGFEPTRMTVGREWRGLTKVELAQKLGLAPAAVLRLETGQRRPNPSVLGRIALALQLPVAFLAGPKVLPIATERCYFRRYGAKPLDRKKHLATAHLLCDLLDFLVRQVALPRLGLSGAFDLAAEPLRDQRAVEEHAMNVRRRFGLGLSPVDHLTGLLECLGIVVRFESCAEGERSSFSVHHRGWAMIFVMGDAEDGGAMRVELARQLGHMTLHIGSGQIENNAEAQADQFASGFLLPAAAFAADCPVRVDDAALRAIAERWKVPFWFAVDRARQLDLLPRGEASGRALEKPAPLGGPVETPALLSRAFRAVAVEWPLWTIAERLCISARDLMSVTGCGPTER